MLPNPPRHGPIRVQNLLYPIKPLSRPHTFLPTEQPLKQLQPATFLRRHHVNPQQRQRVIAPRLPSRKPRKVIHPPVYMRSRRGSRAPRVPHQRPRLDANARRHHDRTMMAKEAETSAPKRHNNHHPERPPVPRPDNVPRTRRIRWRSPRDRIVDRPVPVPWRSSEFIPIPVPSAYCSLASVHRVPVKLDVTHALAPLRLPDPNDPSRHREGRPTPDGPLRWWETLAAAKAPPKRPAHTTPTPPARSTQPTAAPATGKGCASTRRRECPCLSHPLAVLKPCRIRQKESPVPSQRPSNPEPRPQATDTPTTLEARITHLEALHRKLARDLDWNVRDLSWRIEAHRDNDHN